jgi:hypothetical protein
VRGQLKTEAVVVRKGLDHIIRIMQAVKGKKKIAAVVVPRRIAIGLVDDFWPVTMTGKMEDPWEAEDLTPVVDWEERERYCEYVKRGGYVGRIAEVPLFVANDMVVCVLDTDELSDIAHRQGWNLTELQ